MSDAVPNGGELQPPDATGAAAVDAERRQFMHRMLNLGLGLWAAGAVGTSAYVAGRYVWPQPEGGQTGGERSVSFPLAKLDQEPMVKLLVEGQPVGVVRVDGTVHALGLVCTHLGCLVGWSPEARQMVCPCHASRYDINGAVVQGPAPAPLKRYDVRVAGDTVVIS
ncbi:MAG: Rieske 2Fe-2S domain-containing protein [Nitrospirota bacterium]|nr:Rieske 2Fe-2S domain-containing protein [Nitrospirota bacterium]